MLTLSGYDATHSKILESGIKNFLKDGYEKSNLRKICKEAGVTTGAFYRHFDDKENLFTNLVEPFASQILDIYKNYEGKSLKTYESNEELSKNKLLEILKMKEEASVKSVSFFYDNKDIFELLIFSSYGTKYENFIDEIIGFEDKNHKKILNLIYKNGYRSVITDEGLHLINHAYIYALSELVVHSNSKEEAIHNAKIIAGFFNDGWKKIRGL